MMVFKKRSDLERMEWTRDLFNFSARKIPGETNCPYLVTTDTIICQKESEGLVDLEEVRRTGRYPFLPYKDPETK